MIEIINITFKINIYKYKARYIILYHHIVNQNYRRYAFSILSTVSKARFNMWRKTQVSPLPYPLIPQHKNPIGILQVIHYSLQLYPIIWIAVTTEAKDEMDWESGGNVIDVVKIL